MKILKYTGNGFAEIAMQTADIGAKYGLNTAVGDIDGDNITEIITAPGPGPNEPALIKVWKLEGSSLKETASFTAFDGLYGANIATGDIDGDGRKEIIIGTGPDPKNAAVVRVFKADGTLVLELRPYDAKYGYGVFVASADMDNDGKDEIITGLGPGPQNSAWVKVFKSDGLEISSFLAYPEGTKYGVRVYSGRPGE